MTETPHTAPPQQWLSGPSTWVTEAPVQTRPIERTYTAFRIALTVRERWFAAAQAAYDAGTAGPPDTHGHAPGHRPDLRRREITARLDPSRDGNGDDADEPSNRQDARLLAAGYDDAVRIASLAGAWVGALARDIMETPATQPSDIVVKLAVVRETLGSASFGGEGDVDLMIEQPCSETWIDQVMTEAARLFGTADLRTNPFVQAKP